MKTVLLALLLCGLTGCAAKPPLTRAILGVAQESGSRYGVGNIKFADGMTADCIFDGTFVSGDTISISSTISGACHDTGIKARKLSPSTEEKGKR
jgi:hypothetical protein